MTREEQSALKEQRIRTIWEMILKEHLSVVEISKRLQVTRAYVYELLKDTSHFEELSRWVEEQQMNQKLQQFVQKQNKQYQNALKIYCKYFPYYQYMRLHQATYFETANHFNTSLGAIENGIQHLKALSPSICDPLRIIAQNNIHHSHRPKGRYQRKRKVNMVRVYQTVRFILEHPCTLQKAASLQGMTYWQVHYDLKCALSSDDVTLVENATRAKQIAFIERNKGNEKRIKSGN